MRNVASCQGLIIPLMEKLQLKEQMLLWKLRCINGMLT